MKWISERESAHLEELIAKAEAEPDAVYEQPPRAYLREAAVDSIPREAIALRAHELRKEDEAQRVRTVRIHRS